MIPYFIGKIHLTVVIFCLTLAIGGCGFRESREDIPPLTPARAQTAPDPTPTLMTEIFDPISPVSPLSPIKEPAMTSTAPGIEPIKGSKTALAAAIADLSQQIGVLADEIKLISIEPVMWSDASLGCPQEGFMYAQVITPGYLIVLEAQGRQYEYHTDQTTNVVLCEP